MLQKFSKYDIRVVAHYLGALVMLFSFCLTIPFFIALIFQEWEPASRYALAIGIALIASAGMRMLRVQPGRLTHQQALVVTGLSWIVLAFFAAIPLALSGHYANYLDALFEAVSGLSTTGVTLATDLEHMSYADNTWRFVMHLIGGLGLIVIALSLGLLGRGTSGLYSSEGRSEHVLPNIVQTTRLISRIALIVIAIATVILSVVCIASGIEPVRSVLQACWIAISGFMTGGFVPTSQSIGYYHSYPMELICILLMLLGAVNFALFVKAWRGDTHSFFKDIEIKTGVIWLAVVTAVFMASLCSSGVFGDVLALIRRGVFMVVAAASTAGFQVVTNNQMTTVFSSGAFLILAMLMAVGGSSGSTAGGIKLSRIGLVAKSVVATTKEALSPSTARVSVTYYHLGRQVLNNNEVKTAMTVSALFIITYLLGSLAGIAFGYDATAAIFDSVAMASNGGLTSGIVTHGMPVPLEIIYMLEMWAGRLEFITLIALVVKIVVSIIPDKKAKN